MTGIPILTETPREPFIIFNDPDTGIRLPDENNQSEGRTHIAVSTITAQLKRDFVQCVITFDQSYYHQEHGSTEQQRRAKMNALRKERFHSMYYKSHAPFCFAVSTKQALIELKNILTTAGIPKDRFEEIPEAGEPSTEGYDLQNR